MALGERVRKIKRGAGKCFKVPGDSQVVRSEVQPQQQMDDEGDRDELRKKPFDSWDHRFIDN
uniref:Uncharacterized protein n=1 Tax=Oryza glumipatula TaxID=40148 RepID=A0A0E0BAC6_9ORYZ